MNYTNILMQLTKPISQNSLVDRRFCEYLYRSYYDYEGLQFRWVDSLYSLTKYFPGPDACRSPRQYKLRKGVNYPVQTIFPDDSSTWIAAYQKLRDESFGMIKSLPNSEVYVLRRECLSILSTGDTPTTAMLNIHIPLSLNAGHHFVLGDICYASERSIT